MDRVDKYLINENKLSNAIKGVMNDAVINLIVTGVWKVMEKQDKNWRNHLSDEKIMDEFDKEFSKMKIGQPLIDKLKKRLKLKLSKK